MLVALFENFPHTGPWLPSLGLMLLSLPLLVVAGVGKVAFFTAWNGRTREKVFSAKLAKQLAEFGVIILGLWLLLISARWFFWVMSWWPVGDVGRGFYPLFFDMPGHVLLVATLASIALVRLWKKNARTSGAHLLLGAVSIALWLATLLLFVAGASLQGESGLSGDRLTRLTMDSLGIAASEPLTWLAWGQAVFLACAAGGGVALLYLVARRFREDYGRDYYGWAVKRCAWWAVLAGIVQAGWAKAAFWRGALMHQDRAAIAGADWISETITAMLAHSAMPFLVVALCLALGAWLCLVPVLRTQTPLRMKGWMLLHAVLAVVSVTAFCGMYLELFGKQV